MVLSFIAILVVLLSGYLWLTRGFFNALLHLACTLVAGAIAFAAWEPLSYFLLGLGKPSSAFSFLNSLAWGLGLALPFGISLALLRLAVDSVVRANIKVDDTANMIGGGVCGLLSGVIASGIVVLSIGLLRVDTEFMGNRAVNFQNGSVARQSGLWVPTDKITAWFYSSLSESVLASDEPLSKWHPDLTYTPTAMRSSFADGKARNAAAPEDFSVSQRFTVGKPAQGQQAPALSSLLADAWDPQAQSAKDFDGQDYPPGSYIEGYVVRFKASAKEGDGKIIVGGQQIWIVAENAATSERKTLFPIAVSSQAQSAQPWFGRWRLTQEGDFIASVGGLAEADFVFEFIMPAGYEPLGLYVKGSRHIIAEGPTAKPAREFASASERDQFIIAMGAPQDPAALGKEAPLPTNMELNDDGSIKVKTKKDEMPDGIRYTNALGFTIQKGTHGTLEIEEPANILLSGTQKFKPGAWDNAGLERSLRIEKLAVTGDTVVLQIDVSINSRVSIFGRSLDMAESILPPILKDSNGGVYQPIGYVYRDNTLNEISYDPAQPIRAMSQLPKISKSRPDQKLTLLFRVSLGVEITSFSLGDKKIIATYDPPLKMDRPQK